MKKKNVKVDFALQGIKTEQFALLMENYTSKKDVSLSTEFQFKLDQVNQKIGAYLAFEFQQAKKIFIKIQVSCHFKIKESSWGDFNQGDNAKLVIPVDFIRHIAVLTVGTARGVLHAKTEGTEFSKFILPTINVAEMIKEDAVFEITE